MQITRALHFVILKATKHAHGLRTADAANDLKIVGKPRSFRHLIPSNSRDNPHDDI